METSLSQYPPDPPPACPNPWAGGDSARTARRVPVREDVRALSGAGGPPGGILCQWTSVPRAVLSV